MLLGGVDEGACHVTPQRIIVTDAWQIDGKTVVHCGVGTALGHPVTVGFRGHLGTPGRPVIRAVGLVHVGQQRGALMCSMPAASQPRAGRPHLGRLPRGWREHAATAPDGALVRVDRVVLGLPTMAGLHGQGRAEDAREAFVSTQVGQPGPGDQPFDRDDEPRSRGRPDVQTGLWGRLPMTRHEKLAVLMEDADVPGTGMQVAAAVTLGLGGVPSP